MERDWKLNSRISDRDPCYWDDEYCDHYYDDEKKSGESVDGVRMKRFLMRLTFPRPLNQDSDYFWWAAFARENLRETKVLVLWSSSTSFSCFGTKSSPENPSTPVLRLTFCDQVLKCTFEPGTFSPTLSLCIREDRSSHHPSPWFPPCRWHPG